MSASAFAKTLPQSLSSRTVLVKVTPAPRGLSERRAILKGLQMTGLSPEIEVFRKLDDDSSFIAVTAAAGTAKNLVDDSPFRRVVITAPAPAWGGAAVAAAISSQQIAEPVVVQSLKKMEKNVKKKSTWWRRRLAAQEKEAAEKQAAKELSEKLQLEQQQLESGDAAATAVGNPAGPAESLSMKKKEFTIHVFPANKSFSHQRMLGRGLLHGPWPLAINPFTSSKEQGHQDQAELRDTFVSAALRKSVPPGRLAPSLKDWDTGRQTAVGRGTAASFDDRAAWELLGGGVHGAAFIQARLHQKRIAAETPAVMRGLAAVARQGQHRQRERRSSYGRDEEEGEAGFGQRDDFG
ncbi:hypothetical protein PG996_000512 [Apiospora saccharicola]|uniref:Uncharacterized protein n=1 Tax=Apiospora saccharicola TaxID=335842 RepID=A0ABR1WE05_9PEZI